MAEAVLLGSGGTVTSDDTTATKAVVVFGYTYMGQDTDDDIGTGILADRTSLTRAISVVRSAGDISYRINQGAYRVNTDSGYPEIVADLGAVAAAGSLTAAKLLAGQSAFGFNGTATSDANAPANRIMSGYSAYVNGAKVNGTLTIQSVVNFNLAQYASLQVIATWALPSIGPWSGVRIVCKQGGYPANVSDGTLFYEGSGNSAIQSLAAGAWYFRAWNYITTNEGRMYGNYNQNAITNSQISGSQTFTSSGTFTVPAAVRTIHVFGVGGGAAGGQGGSYGGNGGGGGRTVTVWNISVSPGQQIAVGIGAGGTSFGGGGSTTFGGYLTAPGGSGDYGGSGGGFGGMGYISSTDSRANGGKGGTNGGKGDHGWWGTQDPMNGQGYTTRAFGEGTGTIYSGGGGGATGIKASTRYHDPGPGGADGGGYGGRDSYSDNPPLSIKTAGDGWANTGGGGGGAGGNRRDGNDGTYINSQSSGNGGSGILMVRW